MIHVAISHPCDSGFMGYAVMLTSGFGVWLWVGGLMQVVGELAGNEGVGWC